MLKKRHNMNGKLGIDKRNNYSYVPNAPRKLCQNCSSSNHLNHAYKNPVIIDQSIHANTKCP